MGGEKRSGMKSTQRVLQAVMFIWSAGRDVGGKVLELNGMIQKASSD